MCQKATELQVLRPLGSEMREGDLLYSWYTGANRPEYDAAGVGLCYPYEDWGPDERQEGDTWLPRQDQLQELAARSIWALNHAYARWLYDADDDGLIDLHIKHDHGNLCSMEQLWLAFVMSEKYGKQWDGGDWIEKAN